MRIYASDSAGIGTDQQQIGTRSTYAIGKNLHVVAVTTGGQALVWGQLYRYDLAFGQLGNDQVAVPESGTRLFDAEVLAPDTVSAKKLLLYDSSEVPLTLPPPTLPSFVLPPADLNNLRIIHASCRKPHGEAKDALQVLDELIRVTASAPVRRPHQLFLTGDQIYADDVADALLMMLTDAGDTLLGWNPPESLPGVHSGERAANLPPGKRGSLVTREAGLSTGEGKSHLFSAGEFYAMYLFAWSNTLWTLRPPDFADVYPAENSAYEADAGSGVAEKKRRFSKLKQEFEKEIKNLGEYVVALPAVRRALANIPVYTIFDDHEITDDWYIHRKWCVDALTSQLGSRVIQNGLLAYAIFQAWGNTPHQFAAQGSDGVHGRKLLEAAASWDGTANNSALADIKAVVGLPTAIAVEQHKKLQHTPESLDWHYSWPFTVGGPQYEVIVLDSRTQRGFPNGKRDPPALISDAAALDAQMPATPAPGTDGVTIVIAPAPVIGVRLVEEYIQGNAPTHYAAMLDREAWVLVRKALELLMGKLFTRSSRIVVLSGDVHYGFSSHVSYWAPWPYGTPEPTMSVLHRGALAQLTSSALKNESSWPPTRTLHRLGFTVGARLPMPLHYAGWHTPPNVTEPGNVRWTPRDDPPVVNVRLRFSVGTAVDRQPDWRYRIDYILSAPRTPTIAVVPNPPSWSLVASLVAYLATAKEYKKYAEEFAAGAEIVGLNNIGEVTFHWAAGDDKAVIQQLWWWLSPAATPSPLSKCTISLRLTDAAYPMPAPLKTGS